MKLSIVIVNYNVKYFLEQCLNSVLKAIKGIPSEVFVVDNQSVDGSVEMLKEKFPWAHLIVNQDNVGFSKANNQAIRIAQGEYILLLNPDTVVEENTFSLSLAFMDQHPEAGALGIKMIDGKGNFLPESKRGLPTPWVAFYKIFGLAALFPRSKKFARYHMGHLDKNQNHEVEILAGAFMLIRKEALDKSGLLDENFFMYGEDIDLSYRIIKAGYKNYYFADSSIIHYKGESTKKGSLNYVYVFYKAMIIFARKHFSGTHAGFFSILIHLAIYLRAFLSILKRFLKALSLPLFDSILLIAGLFYITDYWEKNHRFIKGGEYPDDYLLVAFPLYTLIWITAIYITGGYQRPTKIASLLRGVLLGSIVILTGYSLLDEGYRFSRAIILLGSFWAAIGIPASRYFLQKLFKVSLLASPSNSKRLLIVGKPDETQRVENLLKQTLDKKSFVGLVSPDDNPVNKDKNYIGKLNQIKELARIFNIDEVIFCSRDISGNDIFKYMGELNPLNIEIKIAPEESQFVIGSNSIDNQGSWYTLQFNAISKPANKRAKRTLDIIISIFLLLSFPLNLWWVDNKAHYFSNIIYVLRGIKTWVGYNKSISVKHLPVLRDAVLKVTLTVGNGNDSTEIVNQMNQLYAKDYNIWNDFNFIFHFFKKLGN